LLWSVRKAWLLQRHLSSTYILNLLTSLRVTLFAADIY